MIDPKELRLKNKIKVSISKDSAVYEVMGIDFATYTVRLSGVRRYEWVSYDKLIPIELSPEILEVCGLMAGGLFPDTEYYSLEDGKLYFEGEYTTTDVKYLHQLQNLYFVLTGRELEVNL